MEYRITGLLKRLRSGTPLRDFARDRSGNFAMMTAVMLVPIMGAVGMAVDYSNMSTIRSQAQNALDASSLQAAKMFGEGFDDAQIALAAEQLFVVNMNGREDGLKFTYHGMQERGDVLAVKVSAAGTYKPVFMGAFYNMMETERVLGIGASAETAIAATTVEMAFVLDNSGSMAGSKISTLKTAATALVTDLRRRVIRGSDPDAVRFAVVPFAASVNVGSDNANAAWMDTKGTNPVHHENFDWSTVSGAQKQANGGWKKGSEWLTRQWLYGKIKADWGGCVEARPYPYNQGDAKPDTSNPSTLFVPMFAPDEPDLASWLESWNYTNSYIDDFKANPGRKNSSTYVGNATKQYRRQSWVDKYLAYSSIGDSGPNEACTSEEILPLTANVDHVTRTFRDMVANGNTNIAEGVAWGIRVLSPGEPFTQGRAYDADRNVKAMVVMSDGENTYSSVNNTNRSTYGPYGYSGTDRIYEGADDAKWRNSLTQAIDTHMLAACEEAKANGVTVYTIAFDVDERSNVAANLKACASTDRYLKSPLYYNASSNSDLEKAFKSIGSHVSALRVFM